MKLNVINECSEIAGINSVEMIFHLTEPENREKALETVKKALHNNGYEADTIKNIF